MEVGIADVLVTVTDKRQGEPSGLALPKSKHSSSGSDKELVHGGEGYSKL